MVETTTLTERTTYIAQKYDLTTNAAIALQLAELGYSNSGIATKLDVTRGTVNKYQVQAEERIGELVWESLPKTRRYDTFPSEDSEYTGDHVNYEEDFVQRSTPLNKGTVDSSVYTAENITLDL